MKIKSVVPIAAVLMGGASLFFAAPAFAEEAIPDTTSTSVVADDQVCDELSSGKKDVNGTVTEIVLTAPEGNLITKYCVKAGSTQNGNGPVYVELEEPVASLTITYPGGRDISHYSFSYEPAPTPTPTPTPTPEPTPTPSDPPAGGGDGGAKLAETGFEAGWLPFAGIGALALGAALVVPRLVAKRR